jgi:hypothetical protein
MARTVEVIFNELLSYKNGMEVLTGLTSVSDYQDFLTQLNSDSKVANWVLELYNQSVVIAGLEQMMDDSIADIQTIIDSKQVGTGDWYRTQVLKFQYTDVLQMIDNVPSYTSIDTTKQIIEFCSVNEESGVVYIKVRRKTGVLLSQSEYNALYSYLEKIKIIGTKIVIYNFEPDDIELYYTILYSGEVGLDNLKVSVDATINNYLSTLAFDTKLKINAITDILQNVTGVVDPQFTGLKAKKNTDLTYTDYGLAYSYDMYAGCGVLKNSSITITYTLG